MTAKRWMSVLMCWSIILASVSLQAAGWLGGWSFRQALTLDGSQIEGDLTNFPVLVRLTGDNFDFGMAAPAGRDVRFTGADGLAPLAFERESHNAAGLSASYWVRLPLVSAASNTTFYLYFGNRAASDAATPAEVWDDAHVGVWHLNGANGVTQSDSTAAGNNLVVNPVGLDHGSVLISNCDNLEGWSVGGAHSLLSADSLDKKTDTAAGSATSIGLTVTNTVAGQTNILTYQPSAPLALGKRSLDFFVTTTKAFDKSDIFQMARVYLYDTAGNYRYYNLKTGYSLGGAAGTGQSTRGYDLTSGGTASATAPDLNNIDRLEWVLVSANATAYSVYIDSLFANGALNEGTASPIGGGVTFYGYDQYLATASLTIDTTNGLSLSAWVRPRDATVYGFSSTPLVSLGGANWAAYYGTFLAYQNNQNLLGYSSVNPTWDTYPNGISSTYSAAGMSTGAWHHVAATFLYDSATSNSTMRLFLDGVLKDQTTPGMALRPLIARPAILGAYASSSVTYAKPIRNFHGDMDEVRVSKTARSVAWMTASYANQKPGSSLLRQAPLETTAEWLPGWSRRLRLSINPEAVDSDLTNFPVLVRLMASNFDFARAASDGTDIRFMSGDNRVSIDFERESHDAAAQTADYWVKLPLVSATEPTYFYLYYGNRDARDGARPAEVWDDRHVAIWHLASTQGSTQPDSSRNQNHLGQYGTVDVGEEGVVGHGIALGGTDEIDPRYLVTPVYPAFDTSEGVTFSAWACPTNQATPIVAAILCWGGGNWGPYAVTRFGYRVLGKLEATSAAALGATNRLSYGQIGPQASGFTTGQWHHAAMTVHYDEAQNISSLRLYLNGIEVLNDTRTGRGLHNPLEKHPLVLGGQTQSPWPYNPAQYLFNGWLDEARVSNVRRSADWLSASYRNQMPGSTMVRFGNVEPPQGLLIIVR